MADSPTPANRVHGLLTPQNCTVIFIDYQPQMAIPYRRPTISDRGPAIRDRRRPYRIGAG